jgi:Holliday junction resolvase RusA-like endonuclease
MTQRVIVDGTLPNLNDYITAERTHRQKAAKLKRECQDTICWAICQNRLQPVVAPVVMRYKWVEKDKRRDLDNVSAFGRKVIQDALVEMGILPNDGWAWIRGFVDEFEVDKENPRIEVEIVEV